jgi:hypothetical protein
VARKKGFFPHFITGQLATFDLHPTNLTCVMILDRAKNWLVCVLLNRFLIVNNSKSLINVGNKAAVQVIISADRMSRKRVLGIMSDRTERSRRKNHVACGSV